MTVEARSANERIALLLGWEPHTTGTNWQRLFEDAVLLVSVGCPDFRQWPHFPEMQEYVRGLDVGDCQRVLATVHAQAGDVFYAPMNITPTILRDAVLACIDEQEDA